MNITNNKKLIGFAAYSGTGKTTLIKSIVKILKELNYRVSVIKHAHHNFDIDKPKKDSYEIRKSGAENMLISSEKRWALMHENINNEELNLSELINIVDSKYNDIILVEGFKAEKFPKIELYRRQVSKSFLYDNDESIVAIAHDENIEINTSIKKLDINNPHEIAKYIIEYLGIGKKS
tara:strand:+ start:444 stop:977 length:534 start_codon:yes stop_codon:yes gene_type:complete